MKEFHLIYVLQKHSKNIVQKNTQKPVAININKSYVCTEKCIMCHLNIN